MGIGDYYAASSGHTMHPSQHSGPLMPNSAGSGSDGGGGSSFAMVDNTGPYGVTEAAAVADNLLDHPQSHCMVMGDDNCHQIAFSRRHPNDVASVAVNDDDGVNAALDFAYSNEGDLESSGEDGSLPGGKKHKSDDSVLNVFESHHYTYNAAAITGQHDDPS